MILFGNYPQLDIILSRLRVYEVYINNIFGVWPLKYPFGSSRSLKVPSLALYWLAQSPAIFDSQIFGAHSIHGICISTRLLVNYGSSPDVCLEQLVLGIAIMCGFLVLSIALSFL